MKHENSLLQQIAKQDRLPTLPHIVLQVIDTCNEDADNLSELSSIVEKDLSLSNKILSLINSSYYGLPHRIADMYQAVVLLGPHAIKNIAICASIYEAFSQEKDYRIFNLPRFWRHSLKCAIVSALIAKKVHFSQPHEAFLAGLLHDMGKVVLWINFPEAYENLLVTSSNQQNLIVAGEKRLGATHCQVGAWLLHSWSLPSFVADAVLYHHEPTARISNALPLVQIVYTANVLSQDTIDEQKEGFQSAADIFGLGRTDVEELLSYTDAELIEVAGSLHIDIAFPRDLDLQVSEIDVKKHDRHVRKASDLLPLFGVLKHLLAACNQDDILEVVQRGLKILYEAENVFFFLTAPEKEALVGTTTSKNVKMHALKDLIIPMQVEKSIFIACLQLSRPLESFTWPSDPEPVILDEQITRLTGKEGVLCIPMIVHGEHIGVIVLGLDKAALAHFSKHISVLTFVAKQTAVAIHLDHLRRNRIQTKHSEYFKASSAMVRKALHEVNNPLSIIKNYLKILDVKLFEQNMPQDEIRVINEEIDRAALILKDLAAFSEVTDVNMEHVDINSLLSDIFKITRESLLQDSKIELHPDLDPSLPTVMAEKNGLKQVFINLIKNSIEAMAEGGNLFVQTRSIAGATGVHLSSGESESQPYAEITIKDEGSGIPDKIKPRIFEALVSSKGRGHTGLGLSIVHNIIKAFNGTITCESNNNRGTVFTIALPITAAKKD